MSSSSSSHVASDKISLKRSPMIILLTDLFERYPGVDHEVVERIVIETKCDPDLATERLTQVTESSGIRYGQRTYNSSTVTESRFLDAVGQSRPRTEMKVYRLDHE
jgi:hypothetical protein